MRSEVFRYAFSPDVPMEEVEITLLLSIWGCEALHGEAQTRLDAALYLDSEKRACVIEGGTAVGRDFNKLFVGYFGREFGPDAFRVERVADQDHQPQEAQEEPCELK